MVHHQWVSELNFCRVYVMALAADLSYTPEIDITGEIPSCTKRSVGAPYIRHANPEIATSISFVFCIALLC